MPVDYPGHKCVDLKISRLVRFDIFEYFKVLIHPMCCTRCRLSVTSRCGRSVS